MEAGRRLFSSPSPFPHKANIRNCSSSSSSSVLMLHEQIAPALASAPSTRINSRLSLRFAKEEHTSLETLDRMQREAASSVFEEEDHTNFSEEYIKDAQERLLRLPGICYLFPSLLAKGEVSAYMTTKSLPLPSKAVDLINVEPCSVVALAQEALLASREAMLLAEDSKLLGSFFDESPQPILTNDPTEEEKIIRSTRLLERRSKRRGVKPKVKAPDIHHFKKPDVQRKVTGTFDQNDPLRLFLWGPETKQLLTAKQESELILNIQDLVKLEEVKVRFQREFAREPTLVEWAKAVGLSQLALQSKLHFGNSSREKLINANLRMVVHIAKQYQGRGLSFQDMLQEGSLGLMKSVEKFKPQVGCRFATYAYWWIRQAIKKAIFQHSRAVRLPVSIYALLSKVIEARKSCIEEGNHQPSKEEVARHAGITVEKMERLLFTARMPVSLQQPVWADDRTTYQEITADNSIEATESSVSKRVMRQHVRGLLKVLSPKERKVIRLRYGMEDGQTRSLSEICDDFGLTKERIRQIQSRALYKLKQNLSDHGLDAYREMLI